MKRAVVKFDTDCDLGYWIRRLICSGRIAGLPSFPVSVLPCGKRRDYLWDGNGSATLAILAALIMTASAEEATAAIAAAASRPARSLTRWASGAYARVTCDATCGCQLRLRPVQ